MNLANIDKKMSENLNKRINCKCSKLQCNCECIRNQQQQLQQKQHQIFHPNISNKKTIPNQILITQTTNRNVLKCSQEYLLWLREQKRKLIEWFPGNICILYEFMNEMKKKRNLKKNQKEENIFKWNHYEYSDLFHIFHLNRNEMLYFPHNKNWNYRYLPVIFIQWCMH